MDASQLVQGSPEWIAARVGSLGASRISDVIAKSKSGYRASRANYLAEIVAERLTGQPYPQYENAAMRFGKETEPLARIAYEFHADVAVDQVGLIRHPTIVGTHASPDGIINNDGLLEIKSPQTATHIATLRSEAIADEYMVQMYWAMACSKRLWCDFCSYDPRLPEEMRLFVKRIPRDNRRIHELEEEVTAFLAEVEATVIFLRAKYQKDQAA